MKMVKVISETDSGRNKVFQDTRNNHPSLTVFN